MLISGLGDSSGGQRIIKTPKSSTYMLDFGVGRWRPQAKGSKKPRNEHKFSFWGWWQEEGGQNLENKQSCLLSGWEDGGGGQRMSKSRKRACPCFWGWGLVG